STGGPYSRRSTAPLRSCSGRNRYGTREAIQLRKKNSPTSPSKIPFTVRKFRPKERNQPLICRRISSHKAVCKTNSFGRMKDESGTVFLIHPSSFILSKNLPLAGRTTLPASPLCHSSSTHPAGRQGCRDAPAGRG